MTQLPNVPAFLLGRQAGALAATLRQGIGSSQPPHISIERQAFTLVDAGGNEQRVTTHDPAKGPFVDVEAVRVRPEARGKSRRSASPAHRTPPHDGRSVASAAPVTRAQR